MSDADVVLNCSRVFSNCLRTYLAGTKSAKSDDVRVAYIESACSIGDISAGVFVLLELYMPRVFILEMLVLEMLIVLVLLSAWEYTCNHFKSWK